MSKTIRNILKPAVSGQPSCEMFLVKEHEMTAERHENADAQWQAALPGRRELTALAMSGLLACDMVLEHLLDRIEGRAPC